MARLIATTYLSRFRAIEDSDLGESGDIYRPPAASADNKVGDLALHATGVACKIWDATQAPKIIALVPAIAAARLDKIAFFATTTDIQLGDEIRQGATKFKVTGLGAWQSTTVAALSQVKTRL